MSAPTGRGPATRLGLGVFAAFALLYTATAATTVQGGDAGEFMTLAATGGVAHPPGYPLFSMAVRLAGRLPFGTAAWQASLVSALCGAATLGILAGTIKRHTGSTLAALGAPGLLGVATMFWRYATVSEVFAGGALTAALVLCVAAAIDRGWRGPAATFALGLAVATGVGNHHTVLFLTPTAVLAGLLALPRTVPGAATAIGATLLGLLPGFLAYLTLMQATSGWVWGDTTSLDGLLHHFLRRDYGTFDLGLASGDVRFWQQPMFLLRRWGSEQMLVGPLLAVAGLAVGRSRLFAAGLLGSWLVAGPIFLARFNVPPEALGAVVAARFHILPSVVAALATGLGLARLERSVPAAHRRSLALLLGGVIASSTVAHGALATHRGWTVLQDYLVTALRAVPPEAVVISSGDNFVFGARYVQEVLGERPDVAVVHASLLVHPWYREQLAARSPSLVVVDPELLAEFRPIPELVARLLERRPIYLAHGHVQRGGLRSKLPPVWPESGVLFRVAPPGVSPPPPEVLEAQMERALATSDLRPQGSAAKQRESWEGWALTQVAATWESLATGYEAAGDPVGAERCRLRAESWRER